MADIVITIPNNQLARAVDALCISGGYPGDPDDQPARREFARSILVQYVRRTVLEVERQQAMVEAMAAVTVDPITVE